MSYFSQMVGAGDPQLRLGGHRASPSPRPSCAASPATRRRRSATSGSMWCASPTTCWCRSAWSSPSVLVSQGMIQNFKPYTVAKTYEPYTIQVPEDRRRRQARHRPPTASPSWSTRPSTRRRSSRARWPPRSRSRCSAPTAAATSNANAAHPFENPTPLSNFLQMLSIFAIPSALTYYLGRMVKNQRHGWAVWGAMFAMFVAGVLVCWKAEADGQPDPPEARASPRRTATWRARRCASASSIPRSSPRSRPTPRAARSTRCTTPSRRSAAWCRCSTSRPAR